MIESRFLTNLPLEDAIFKVSAHMFLACWSPLLTLYTKNRIPLLFNFPKKMDSLKKIEHWYFCYLFFHTHYYIARTIYCTVYGLQSRLWPAGHKKRTRKSFKKQHLTESKKTLLIFSPKMDCLKKALMFSFVFFTSLLHCPHHGRYYLRPPILLVVCRTGKKKTRKSFKNHYLTESRKNINFSK